MSPKAFGIAVSQPMSTAVHITWHGAPINFGDLTPYLTYGCQCFPPSINVPYGCVELYIWITGPKASLDPGTYYINFFRGGHWKKSVLGFRIPATTNGNKKWSRIPDLTKATKEKEEKIVVLFFLFFFLVTSFIENYFFWTGTLREKFEPKKSLILTKENSFP